MSQVKIGAVKGGQFVTVAVERGNEVYDVEDGILYEKRMIAVDDIREQLVDAIKRGKRLEEAANLTEGEGDGNG